MACAGLSLVTPVSATRVTAMIAMAPMGNTLPMMATIVAMNNASMCHAAGVTPVGTGITNQMIKPTKMATAA